MMVINDHLKNCNIRFYKIIIIKQKRSFYVLF